MRSDRQRASGAPTQADEAITCAVAVNAPGLSLWSRTPFAGTMATRSTTRWPPGSTRATRSFSATACSCRGKRLHTQGDRRPCLSGDARPVPRQSPIERPLLAKMELLTGVSARIAEVSGTDKHPPSATCLRAWRRSRRRLVGSFMAKFTLTRIGRAAARTMSASTAASCMPRSNGAPRVTQQ